VTSTDLSDEGLAAAASAQGIDPAALRRCAEEPATEARIDRDRALYVEAGGDGVPLLYVGTTRIDGAPTREALETALDDALARAGK
jgi:predicted DsbA family dithiol-disulfide isomerase